MIVNWMYLEFGLLLWQNKQFEDLTLGFREIMILKNLDFPIIFWHVIDEEKWIIQENN